MPPTTVGGSNVPSGNLLSQKPISLWFHDPSQFQNQDAVVNPDHFANFRNGQLLRIHFPQQHHPSSSTTTSTTTTSTTSPPPPPEPLVVKAAVVDREALARQQSLQISISRDIADRLNLRFRIEVYVELIDPSEAALDHVELSFKEQYLGRSDMWRLQQSLNGTCVYAEKKILFAGVIKATVRRQFINDREMFSGYISENTRMIFRSSSAKYFLFIQLSREMWEFDEDGELYFEKVVNNFLPELFNRWKEEGTNHVVSIILFTRVFYDGNHDTLDDLVSKSPDGRYYKDFYKVIADWESTDDWKSVIAPLKEEQLTFQKDVLMRKNKQGQSIVSGRISVAYEGNVLEAVNLALNPFDNHYVDRDLMRTGLSIILITPGAGKFIVNKKLLRLTNERMTDNGIAMDMVCLSPLPLHVTPLFAYHSSPPPVEVAQELCLASTLSSSQQQRQQQQQPPLGKGGSPDAKGIGNLTKQKAIESWDPLYQDENSADTYMYYSVPHWIDCSFYSHETGQFIKQDKFHTRCKMYELQMMGIMEHDLAGISIPLLSEHTQQYQTLQQQQLQLQQQQQTLSTRTLRNQRSSSSLNDKMSTKSADSGHGNGETYLSRSANFSSMKAPPFLNSHLTNNSSNNNTLSTANTTLTTPTPVTPTTATTTTGILSDKKITTPTTNPIDYEKYDALVFKDSLEPRFNRRITTATPTPKLMTPTKQKNSIESPDRPESDLWPARFTQLKSNTTWHHGDQRRVMSILSQSQQGGAKITFDNNVRKDDSPTRVTEIFRGPSPGREDATTTTTTTSGSGTTATPTRIKPSRRGTMNSNDVRVTAQFTTENGQNSPGIMDDEDMMLVSSSTVDPVPINNKSGSGSRPDGRSKSTNPSPRQNAAGSCPSIHKHSGNSDLIRTSFGNGVAGNNITTRGSPSHTWYSRLTNASRNGLINPCNPADFTLIFTSHLRRWLHALPHVDHYDGARVHWRSLTSPACLPLTTDYFPSNEELKKHYNHYMYTVSASEDVNLYQAGDRTLSEHIKTANLLTEMISQRLAQGFQIIVDITASGHQKPVNKVYGHGLSGESGASGSGSGTGIGSGSGGGGPPHSSSGMVTTTTSGSNHGGSNSGIKDGKDINGGPGITATGNTAVPGTTSKTLGTLHDEADKNKWKHMVWWLSMGHQVHQLTFDSSGQNVEVRRYVRTINFDTEKIAYKCAIWPKNVAGYRPKSLSFSYPSLLYAWNYLDHLVAGYQEELTDNLRFWRARFIVIPRETLPSNAAPVGGMTSSQDHLDDEEKRLALFDTWLQNLRKAKWLTPQEREEMQKRRKRDLGYTDFGLRITTMDPSAYVTSEALKSVQSSASPSFGQHGSSGGTSSLLSSIVGQPLGLSRESKSKDIAMAMRDPKAGVKMFDRRWHFKVYRHSFVGSEMVDWVVGQFDDISTREEAVSLGNALMERNPPLFVSSTNRHAFLDGHYFYRLHSEFMPSQQPQKAWFTMNNSSLGKSKTQSTSPSTLSINSKDTSASNTTTGGSNSIAGGVTGGGGPGSAGATAAGLGGGSGAGSATGGSVTPVLGSGIGSGNASSPQSPRRSKPTIEYEMSRSMIIDVDPYKKSNRRETAILHYDTLHNAYNCYHFQLNWLGCTAQLVQELVQNWSRQAERCGLLVVEGSVDQAYDDSENNNPFQCPVAINLAAKPPPVSELNARYEVPDNFYAVALVRHLGFVLDVEADDKFERAKAEGVQVEYTYIKEAYKYDQYIHRSGVSFVQIRPNNEGFYWVNNRLYTNHTPALVLSRSRKQGSSTLVHPEVLRQNFQEFCSDAQRLEAFWEATRNNLVSEDLQDNWAFENARVPSIDTTLTEDTASTAPTTAATDDDSQHQLPTAVTTPLESTEINAAAAAAAAAAIGATGSVTSPNIGTTIKVPANQYITTTPSTTTTTTTTPITSKTTPSRSNSMDTHHLHHNNTKPKLSPNSATTPTTSSNSNNNNNNGSTNSSTNNNNNNNNSNNNLDV
ncbi:hypothetical protein BDA99DRAFT_556413 [Phascolomyces articulosus]|uniref:Vacuolar membrane-associated protein IML1 n=1 Tax=Phascolomyces articulosus TaxID=60185 RepID=A0AAD5K7E3_9FUNG|nr:hypothetical protein BDA99DRAFT_556413 [Phascolomyces articulosus]